MADRRNMPVEDLIRSQLQSDEEFTEQRSSHFKLCIAVNFKISKQYIIYNEGTRRIMYSLPARVTTDIEIRMFQYKI